MDQMTGAQLALRTLVEEGVTHVFGVAGTSEIPLIRHVVEWPQLRYVMSLHEGVAVGMADGYARARSDGLAVALLHAAQGTLNGLGYIRAASRDRVPLVVISGAAGTGYAINEPNHHLNGMAAVLDSVTKWTWQVARGREIPWAIHRAVTASHAAPEGPVQVVLPQNCLVELVDEPAPASVWAGVRQRVQPEAETVDEMIRLLDGARRPLIFGGAGVARAKAVPDLVEFAERLNAPVVSEAVDRGPMIQAVVFPGDHPLSLGYFSQSIPELMTAVRDSDLIIALGARTTYQRVVGEWIHAARILQIDPNAWELGKNHPCALGVVGDIRSTLRALNDRLRPRATPAGSPAWTTRTWQSLGGAPDAGSPLGRRVPLTPRRIVEVMDASTDKDAVIIVDDSQSLSHYLKRHFVFTTPDTLYGSLASHLGWGLPAALGVQLARPDHRVLCLVSDGSLMFAPQALWTAVRYRIPLTVLVANNGGFVSLRQELAASGGAGAADVATAVDEPPIDLAGMARSFGVDAHSVTDADELASLLDQTEWCERPRLLDVRLSGDVRDWSGSWFVPGDSTL